MDPIRPAAPSPTCEISSLLGLPRSSSSSLSLHSNVVCSMREQKFASWGEGGALIPSSSLVWNVVLLLLETQDAARMSFISLHDYVVAVVVLDGNNKSQPGRYNFLPVARYVCYDMIYQASPAPRFAFCTDVRAP